MTPVHHAEPTPAEVDAPAGGIGASVERPDGRLKVTGEFAYSSDLWADGMLWGATLRSPHPSARIRSIDVSAAVARPGVELVLTHADVPGEKLFGLQRSDQPVLAWDRVRYEGEPVAIVAADHPETARRALGDVVVTYETLEPLVDMDAALAADAPTLHPDGNVAAELRIVHGDLAAGRALADVIVTGEYEVGMQDQAFLGPESGLAIPTGDGGVELYVATQNLYQDRRQVAAVLGVPEERVIVTLAGVGGAFGGREDVSMQIHASLLAVRSGRPVKMVYSREESFFGHVHRHPARLRYEHGATHDGRLAFVRARLVLDGGAYASSSPAVCGNAATTAVGPYEVEHALVETVVAYTNNPPCGAMRGFGAVQTCFAYESQMDKLATALRMDPVELRRRNALRTGSTLTTGQRLDGPAPVAELLDRLDELELPPEPAGARDMRERPGGVANTTRGEGVRRGVGFAVGFKNVGVSRGKEDASSAHLRLTVAGGEPLLEIHTSAAELGQGGIMAQVQIARSELGVERVAVLPIDTRAGDAGSTSASRQTWMTGGAVQLACAAVREQLLARAAARLGVAPGGLALRAGAVVGDGGAVLAIAELVDGDPIAVVRRYVGTPTQQLDADGQGDAHRAFQFAAHRAIVDVDVELGLVRVVELATAQDVGTAINPMSVEGQIEGGSAQGMGLALMEEIQLAGGRVRNPSFTDYLIPTILDMPPVRIELLQHPQPGAPYGLNGMAEAPAISSTPAVVAALRDATGQALTRVPVTPDALVGLPPEGSESEPPGQ